MTIKEIRQLTNLSQPKFCEKYGIPLTTLRKWEQGHRNPTPYEIEWLERIVKGDLKMEKMVSMSTIDEMKDLKDALKATSTENVEDMLRHLTEQEKDCLLRLYVYEDR